MISIAEARKRVLEAAQPLPAAPLPLGLALGRVLSETASAQEPLSPFAASAMDGFALRAGEERELEIGGESRAGAPYVGTVPDGQAIRISTGAALPDGTDAVVMVENAEERDGRVKAPATRPGDNVRQAGEDLQQGATAVEAGARIGPPELALLASAGVAEPVCTKAPRVAVLVTGDELVAPGEPLGPGQIRSSNGVALAAQALAAGAEVLEQVHVGDSLDATRGALESALEADVVVVSGGVSVGPHDHVKPALAELGVRELFWRVSLMPGKPTWFGVRGRTLVFGLPGNPVSAMVTFELFARPALLALQGAAHPLPKRLSAIAAEPLERRRREQAVRVVLEASGPQLRATSTGRQNSHLLTSMRGADALAFVPPGEGELAAGEPVEIELL